MRLCILLPCAGACRGAFPCDRPYHAAKLVHGRGDPCGRPASLAGALHAVMWSPGRDRKSTRLNSSHLVISYAVFCLKKKKLTDSLQYTTPYGMLTRPPSTSLL